MIAIFKLFALPKKKDAKIFLCEIFKTRRKLLDTIKLIELISVIKNDLLVINVINRDIS